MDDRESYLIDDEDNPEWTAEDFARARPARDILPPALFKKLMDNFNKRFY